MTRRDRMSQCAAGAGIRIPLRQRGGLSELSHRRQPTYGIDLKDLTIAERKEGVLIRWCSLVGSAYERQVAVNHTQSTAYTCRLISACKRKNCKR